MTDYPEHEKLRRISDQSQAIGEFLDWLTHERGVELQEFRVWYEWVPPANSRWPELYGPRTPVRLTGYTWWPPGGRERPDVAYEPESSMEQRLYGHFRRHEGWFHVRASIRDLLADYFDIDQNRLEDEKRQMLDAQRRLNMEHT